MGMKMTSWYDIKSLDNRAEEDFEGIEGSSKRIRDMIEQEIANGIPPEKIVLGGFSQGGAMTLYTGLQLDKKLAGYVALSCYLPLRKHVTENLGKFAKEVPVFQCHGDADMVVQHSYGHKSYEYMKNELGLNVTFKSYRGLPHALHPQELVDIKNFLNRVLFNE
eukprot:Clim_evm79s243 gene=Clim_evmTU79s243